MKNALPASRARQLFEDIAEIKAALAVSNMITEKEAAKLLNIEEVTLKGYVVKKKVPEDCFTVSPVNGERFYLKNKLVGL